MEEYNLNIDLPLDFIFRDKIDENTTIQWMQDWVKMASEERKKEEFEDTFTEFEQIPGKVFKNLELINIDMTESNENEINTTDLTFNFEYDNFKNI